MTKERSLVQKLSAASSPGRVTLGEERRRRGGGEKEEKIERTAECSSLEQNVT